MSGFFAPGFFGVDHFAPDYFGGESNPNLMSALLSGTSTLTATLTTVSVEGQIEFRTGGGGVSWQWTPHGEVDYPYGCQMRTG